MAMDSKFALALFLFISSSSVLQVLSNDQLSQSLGGLLGEGGGGGGAASPCMQKLMPCQPYLHSSSPPPACCTPLKEMVAKDTDCLCKVFDNPETLKSLNLTKDEALALPKACGASADVSVCNKDASPGGSPATSSSATGSLSSNASAPAPSASPRSARMFTGGIFLSFLAVIVPLY